MSEINYILNKPIYPATGSSSGQPVPATRSEPGESPNVAGQLPSPDISFVTPEPMPVMRRLDLAKGAEWCRILRAARERDEAGKPLLATFALRDVATMVGTSAATLSRLVTKFGSLSDAELTPERLAPQLSGGRDCEWEFLLKNAAVRAKLLELYFATVSASHARAANDRRTAKLATALNHFRYEPECPAKLRERLRAGYQPAPFVNFLRSAVTPEMEAKLRGPKHYQLYGPSSVRDWTVRLPNGDRFECPAVYSMSADDMSENHPFYVQQTGEAPILSRQGLYALWAKHIVWQSVELVARVRESYTAADILRWFYKMCLSLGGVPPFIEFEQGVWRARKITGFALDGEWIVEEVLDRPAMADAEKNSITNGLGLCGVTVKYKTKAHQKHIETSFNPLQTVMAIVARKFECIGRYAGEFEHGAKQLRRVRAGSHTPAQLGFASQAELADCIQEAFRRLNEQPSAVPGKTRAEAHWDDLDKVGLLPITERLFAACLPGELRKTTIRGGYINVDCRRDSFQYRHEMFGRLGDGYELFYKFDDTDPNLGCAVFNRAAQGNSANFQNWKPGEFMFCAAREIPGPQFELTTAPAGVEIKTVEALYGPGAIDQGDLIRRKQDKFNATQFRSMPRPGQIAVRSASARDGRGNVVEVTNQAPPAPNGAAAPEQCVGNAPAAALPPRPVRPRGGFNQPPPTEAQVQDRRARLAQRAARARELQRDTILDEQHDAVPN